MKRGSRSTQPTLATIDRVAHVSNTSVLKHTGKSWNQWIEILDRLGARALVHKEIAAVLKKKYKLTLWWQHEVATGFEVHIGRKLPGRNAKGLFSMTVTKSLLHDQKRVWTYLKSAAGIDVWLKPMSKLILAPKNSFEVEGGIFGEVRTLKAPSRVRLSWQEVDWQKPTYLQILIVPRPKQKCLLIFQHEGITTAAIKAALRNHWRTAVEEFAQFIKQSESNE